MEQLTSYIKPELMIVTVILYFIGVWLKQIQTLKDKYIPFILGAIGIVLCAVWVLATSPLRTGQEVAMAVFTALVQGILVAGLSTYVNQTDRKNGISKKQRRSFTETPALSFCLIAVLLNKENTNDQVGNEGQKTADQCVGKLGLHVIDMIRSRSCGGENGRI